jgi:hypothetical protein
VIHWLWPEVQQGARPGFSLPSVFAWFGVGFGSEGAELSDYHATGAEQLRGDHGALSRCWVWVCLTMCRGAVGSVPGLEEVPTETGGIRPTYGNGAMVAVRYTAAWLV